MSRIHITFAVASGGKYIARCQEPGCDWTYTNSIKTDVKWQITNHRHHHAKEQDTQP